jgi:ABC-type branched-subunit amino acid transport system substrate-binding protein
MALIFRPDGAPSALVPVSAADDQGNSSIALALAVSLVSSTGVQAPAGTAADPTFSAAAPTSASGGAVVRVQTAVAASSQIVKASAGNLYGYNIVSGASAGYLMIFDAVSAPADGTVTPKLVEAIAANASIQQSLRTPIRFSTGITMVFSTTGPFTKTASATAFLAGDAA